MVRGEVIEREDAWRPRRDSNPREAVTGLVRVTAGAWVRGATWSLGVSVRLVRAAADPASAPGLARDVVDDLQNVFRGLLGISDISLEARIKRLLPPAATPAGARGPNGALDPETLRAEGAELLRQSAEVTLEESAHPAYAQILLELAPDEARILRLLAAEGAQPAVDVRSTQLVRGGEVVAEELNMIGAAAGLRHVERADVYLANLMRLGLVRFASQPLDDAIAYQVLEAQPHVLAAVREASRARTIHRSVRLTVFGDGFCEVCLPLDEDGLGR